MALQAPVAQLQSGVSSSGQRQAKAFAGNALVMPEFLPLYIGQCRMRKDKLFGRKFRLQALRRIHPGAEKCQLKTEFTRLRRQAARMAGDVPPLGALVGVRAMVGRKHQRSRRQGLRRRCPQGRAQAQGARAHQAATAQHTSLRFARAFFTSLPSRPAPRQRWRRRVLPARRSACRPAPRPRTRPEDATRALANPCSSESFAG